MPRMDLSQSVKLLALVGSIHPEAWDALKPQWSAERGYLDLASLNPQPLPPHPPDKFVLAAVRMTNRLVTLAVEDAARNQGSVEWLSEMIDDWCPTPWPPKWPWPWPGFGPKDGPQPEPWSLAMAKAAGAVVLASVAVRLGEGELGDALVKGAEKLAEAAVNEI